MSKELIESLVGIGYSEEQATNIANKSKGVYFQNDVDNITSKIKSKEQERIASNYVPKADFDNVNNQLRTSQIRSQYTKLGGNESYFNDFIKVNEDLLNFNEQEASALVKTRLDKSAWAKTSSPTLEDFGINNQVQTNKKDSIFGKYDNFSFYDKDKK